MTEKERTALAIAVKALARVKESLTLMRTRHGGYSMVMVCGAENDCERALAKVYTLVEPPVKKIHQTILDTAD